MAKQTVKDVENDIQTVFAKEMKKENKYIVGEKCIREKKKAWKQHFERLLNNEFPWCEEDLSEGDPVLGPLLLSLRQWLKNLLVR